MINSIEKIKKQLNSEFRETLVSCRYALENRSLKSNLIIESVTNFWDRKRKVAEHIIKTFSNHECATSNFTGVSYMDVDNGEAIPFLMSGNRFVYDDAICNRIQLLNQSELNEERLIKELIREIDDEIKIIDLYGELISVLPIRYYYHPDTDSLIRAVNEAFLDLFDCKFSTMEMCFESNSSYEEIDKNINRNKIKLIQFTVYDNKSDSLFDRLNTFDYSLLQKIDIEPIMKLYICFSSAMIEILTIMMSNYACAFTPYIRNSKCIHNLIVVSDFFCKKEFGDISKKIIRNALYAHGLYSVIDLKEYIKEYGPIIKNEHIGSFFKLYESSEVKSIDKISFNQILEEAKKWCCDRNIPID